MEPNYPAIVRRMLRIIMVAAFLLFSSSCKDKETSKTKAEEPATEASATPGQAPVAPKPTVDEALSQRCSKAIAKVSLDELMAAAPDGKPGPEEQAIIDGVRRQGQAACEAEGLSEAQAACLDPIKDLETLFLAADCPAIAAKQPSWLTMPPPEMRKAALEQMKNQPDAGPGDPAQ